MSVYLINAEGLAEAVRLAAKELRRKFEDASIDRLMVQIEISGQVMSGDLKVEYLVGDSMYGEKVRGGSLINCVNEFLRRKGWTERNAPLCLPRVDNDDIKVPANSNGHDESKAADAIDF